MKRGLLVMFSVLAVSSSANAGHFWFGKIMDPPQVEARFGNVSFDVATFRRGEIPKRASMAASLLKHKKSYLGRTFKSIREEFGQHDGYYFRDSIPAYLIQRGAKYPDESWQVVFLPGDDGLVDDLVVHQNCCPR